MKEYEDHIFDAIVAIDVLPYYPDAKSLLEGLKQSVKFGGILIVSLETVIREGKYSYLLSNGRYCHETEYISNLVKGIGFSVLDFKPILFNNAIDTSNSVNRKLENGVEIKNQIGHDIGQNYILVLKAVA